MADNDDIFGSDDDDFNDVNNKPQTSKKSIFSDDESDKDIKDLFGDDDDDNDDVSFAKRSKSYHDEDLNDSDEEDQPRGKKLTKKRKIERPRKKSARSESGKKKKKVEKSLSNSGDEYDSGEDAKETNDDREFIDQDDDLADLKGEYDEDRQDFSEDKKFKPKKTSKPSSSGSSSQPMDLSNPLSRTLAEIKNPKKIELPDKDKEEMAKKLLYHMDMAYKKDLESYQNKQPALLKLKLLDSVQHLTSMQQFQTPLLENDLLSHLNDWIKPKDPNTLPPLALRTAIYKILLNLPVQIDQLKREGNDGPDDKIGKTVVLLRKHKLETPENKRLLKDIMEKWSRIIYEKSTSIDINYQDQNPEILEALRQKYQKDASHSREQAEKVALNKMISQNSSTEVEDSRVRARAPVANGFLFAPIAQTTLKDLKEKKHQNLIEKSLGTDKMKLYKRMIDTKDKSGTHGKRSNNSAMGISINGTNLKH